MDPLKNAPSSAQVVNAHPDALALADASAGVHLIGVARRAQHVAPPSTRSQHREGFNNAVQVITRQCQAPGQSLDATMGAMLNGAARSLLACRDLPNEMPHPGSENTMATGRDVLRGMLQARTLGEGAWTYSQLTEIESSLQVLDINGALAAAVAASLEAARGAALANLALLAVPVDNASQYADAVLAAADRWLSHPGAAAEGRALDENLQAIARHRDHDMLTSHQLVRLSDACATRGFADDSAQLDASMSRRAHIRVQPPGLRRVPPSDGGFNAFARSRYYR